ncbi:DUF2642 domain-containing protein [Peribacillus psychrosaccharolyticus]|uniref:DUF2642 domain-containing protein n=2 Tax=Peribacillus psychrosaccharolyticus TaxID=1407 RepID=A0A974NN74_PERPY|nr:hypothetical protein [Peribacillus psychrosaccharolyticus]MEC2055804.1 DUF2642 domain-containing protein [Peribacillus psychrosaccharolyticus]MED3742979.1 DUF2642 domain-containing protein [Peribacillus psychrosaccharolyticus]QQT00962.1 DUF2642 domain-containing protein [Peribacillus psychrosaccharolyticus]
MRNMKTLIGENVDIELSGKSFFTGILTDVGLDILVLYNGQAFYYIPLLHVHRIQLNTNKDEQTESTEEKSLVEDTEILSYRSMLTNAKGVFSEVYVTGNLTYHGYIIQVLTDYIVFYSPVYKTMYISLSHLKWLTPYSQNINPYTLTNEKLPVKPSSGPLVRSLEEQLKKEIGGLAVFDGGGEMQKIGLLKQIEEQCIELVNANGTTVFLRLNHLKSVYFP